MRIPRIGNFGGGSYRISRGEFDGTSSGYLCGYPESVTLGEVRRVSEGVNLRGKRGDTYADTLGNFRCGSQGI